MKSRSSANRYAYIGGSPGVHRPLLAWEAASRCRVGIAGVLGTAGGILVCECVVEGQKMLWVWVHVQLGHRGRAPRLCRGLCAVLRVAA